MPLCQTCFPSFGLLHRIPPQPEEPAGATIVPADMEQDEHQSQEFFHLHAHEHSTREGSRPASSEFPRSHPTVNGNGVSYPR